MLHDEVLLFACWVDHAGEISQEVANRDRFDGHMRGYVRFHHAKESDFCQTIVRQVGDKKYPVGLRIFLWSEAHGPIFSKHDASVLCCWFGVALGRLNRDHVESAL